MTKLLDFLSRTPVILALFAAGLIITVCFTFISETIGGPFLDLYWTGDSAAVRLAEMSPTQKNTHIWGTLIADIPYPLCLGGCFAGVAAKFAKNWRKWAVLPAFIGVVTDLCENTVQILALSGHESLLFLKTFLTPVKYISFYAAIILALVLLVIALVKRLRTRPV